jgi:hypothetical protein
MEIVRDDSTLCAKRSLFWLDMSEEENALYDANRHNAMDMCYLKLSYQHYRLKLKLRQPEVLRFASHAYSCVILSFLLRCACIRSGEHYVLLQVPVRYNEMY